MSVDSAHTCLPIPFDVEGEKWMMAADEDGGALWTQHPGAMLWMVNNSDKTNPIPVATVQLDRKNVPPRSSCHQPAEDVKGTEIPVAWFAKGMQMVDISNPYDMKVVAHFTPDPPEGSREVLINDICWDDWGLIYLVDRERGLHILERI